MRTDQRRNDEGNQTYDLVEIRDHHEEIARLLALGEKPHEIAHRLGLTTQTISNVRNSPVIKEMIEIIQTHRTENAAEIARDVARLAPEAIKVMEETMKYGKFKAAGEVENLIAMPVVKEQLMAAKAVLDIAVPKTQVRVQTHLVDSEFIRKIKQVNLTTKNRKTEGAKKDEESP